MRGRGRVLYLQIYSILMSPFRDQLSKFITYGILEGAKT
jgi:hypothetical protein